MSKLQNENTVNQQSVKEKQDAVISKPVYLYPSIDTTNGLNKVHLVFANALEADKFMGNMLHEAAKEKINLAPAFEKGQGRGDNIIYVNPSINRGVGTYISSNGELSVNFGSDNLAQKFQSVLNLEDHGKQHIGSNAFYFDKKALSSAENSNSMITTKSNFDYLKPQKQEILDSKITQEQGKQLVEKYGESLKALENKMHLNDYNDRFTRASFHDVKNVITALDAISKGRENFVNDPFKGQPQTLNASKEFVRLLSDEKFSTFKAVVEVIGNSKAPEDKELFNKLQQFVKNVEMHSSNPQLQSSFKQTETQPNQANHTKFAESVEQKHNSISIEKSATILQVSKQTATDTKAKEASLESLPHKSIEQKLAATPESQSLKKDSKFQEGKRNIKESVASLKTSAQQIKKTIETHASPALAAVAHRLGIKLDEKKLVDHKESKGKSNIPNKTNKGKGQLEH